MLQWSPSARKNMPVRMTFCLVFRLQLVSVCTDYSPKQPKGYELQASPQETGNLSLQSSSSRLIKAHSVIGPHLPRFHMRLLTLPGL